MHLRQIFGWIRTHLDSVIALTLAVVVSIGGLADKVGSSVVTNATLATLAILAVSVIRTRATLIDMTGRLGEVQTSLRDSTQSPSADLLFSTQSTEFPIIRNAKSDASFVQETGSLVSETVKSEIASLLRRGGRVQIVASAPDRPTATLLALRNANIGAEDILRRRDSFRAHLRDLAQQVGRNAERLEVRWLPYPVDSTYVIVDQESTSLAERRALVRLAGYRIPFSEKLDFEFDALSSPHVFSHYKDEFEHLFASAHKVVLVEGPPRIGKTSAFMKLVEEVDLMDSAYYAISPALYTSEPAQERRGFALKTSDRAGQEEFARRLGDRNYELVSNAWPDVVPRLHAALSDRRLIILDEIGDLQIKDPSFVRLIQSVLEDPSATMIASISESWADPFARIKTHPRVSLYRMDNESRSSVEAAIKKELQTALRTISIMNDHRGAE